MPDGTDESGALALRVALVTWATDTTDAVERLRTLADEVDVQTDVGTLLADPPDVVVLELAEHPDEAIAIANALRDLPRVFIGGRSDDVDRVREVLPDARFSDWDGIGTILRTAVERPPDEPVAS